MFPGLLSPYLPFQIQAATPFQICSFCSQFRKETCHSCGLGFSTQISPSSSRQPPLPKSVHFVNNFLRKLFTFVAWASLPRSPLPDPGSHLSPKNMLFVTNFLRKLFTFAAWAPLPRSPLPDPGSHFSQNLYMLLTSS